MKRILTLYTVIVGLIAFSYDIHAEEPTELTVKRTESFDRTTGLKRGVMEEFSRNGTNVVRILSLYKEGKLTSVSRFIYVNGGSKIQEIDQDADGFFELRVISPSEDPNTVEVLEAGKDGSLKPASSAKLKEHRQYAKQLQELGVFMRGEIEKAAQEPDNKK
ncbi:MAG TPA: hypothetical protein VGH19_04020 [Verrucomicrobiae bacterium]